MFCRGELLVSGLSLPQEKKYQRVDAAAHRCSEEVKEKTIDLVAKGKSTNSRWTTVKYVLPPDEEFTTQRVRVVEYRTSTILDNGDRASMEGVYAQ
jgi:hypothetical protein